MTSQHVHVYNDIHICIIVMSPNFSSKSKNQIRFKTNILNFLQVIKRILEEILF